MEEYMDMGLVTFDQWEGDTQEPRSPSAPRSDGERVFEEKGRDAIAIFLKKLSNLNIEVLKNKASEALAAMETRYLQRELRQLLCDGGGDDDVEEVRGAGLVISAARDAQLGAIELLAREGERVAALDRRAELDEGGVLLGQRVHLVRVRVRVRVSQEALGIGCVLLR